LERTDLFHTGKIIITNMKKKFLKKLKKLKLSRLKNDRKDQWKNSKNSQKRRGDRFHI